MSEQEQRSEEYTAGAVGTAEVTQPHEAGPEAEAPAAAAAERTDSAAPAPPLAEVTHDVPPALPPPATPPQATPPPATQDPAAPDPAEGPDGVDTAGIDPAGVDPADSPAATGGAGDVASRPIGSAPVHAAADVVSTGSADTGSAGADSAGDATTGPAGSAPATAADTLPAGDAAAGGAAAAPVDPALAEAASVEADPSEPGLVEAAPVEPAPVEPAPVEPAPVEADPVEADPVEADPSEPALVEPVPVPATTTPAAPNPAAATVSPARPGPPGSAVPRPPRPGPPRPGGGPRRTAPTPAPTAAASATPQPSPVASACADPTRWGRVDDDGVVHVRTADGERVVGSWQAGAPVEGLAHFARRFDDLATEVELLFHRLTAGGDPKHALGSARTLRDGLAEASVVGDLAGLSARVDELVAAAEHALGEARSARDAQRVEAVTRKEALAAEAESLAVEATQWKQAGDRFKAILDEWRTIRGVDRKSDEALWKRFSRAREAFNRRRGSHFADLDRQRSGAKHRKEDLVIEAEKLADSTDWGPTAARFRDLMTEWKSAGRAHKDADDVLWQRFRTAQDAFFARRTETFTERDAEFAANAEAKKALLAGAEKIDISDPDAARAALRHVQEQWEAIGKVPRDDIRPLEARLRSVEEKVRDAADRQWRRSDPEAEARVAQFRERVAQFEAQAAKARAAGDDKRAGQAEAQAAQWREWLETAEQAVQHR